MNPWKPEPQPVNPKQPWTFNPRRYTEESVKWHVEKQALKEQLQAEALAAGYYDDGYGMGGEEEDEEEEDG